MKPNKTAISRIQSISGTHGAKTTVPPGQQAAMQAGYLLGKSIRQIAREMHRDPATVSKILKSSEMERIVAQGVTVSSVCVG
jgi:DNA-binding MarR family transcriptional regulator